MQHCAPSIFQSLSLCGLRNKLVNIVAFKPPQVTYKLKLRQKKKMRNSQKQRIYSFDDSGFFELTSPSKEYPNDPQRISKRKRFILNPEYTNMQSSHYPEYDFVKVPIKSEQDSQESIVTSDICNVTSYFLKRKNNQQIASVHLSNNSDYVFLFSHGNACDLGTMIDKLIKLVFQTKINVFAYEYSGYGQSDGISTDINVIEDIQVAYNFLIQQLGYKPTQIIIYGYSIGSGPSVLLTSKPQFPVGGLVVQSGFSSGLRVISKDIDITPYYDIFPNIDRIKFVQCPVFIMHGAQDTIISDDHARQLAQNTSNLFELWIPDNVGHNGLDTNAQYKKLYFGKLKNFIQLISLENDTIPDLKTRNTAATDSNCSCKHYYSTKIV